MSSLDQILYRAVSGRREAIEPVSSSYADPSESSRWQELLDPWLRVGAPPGRGYLHFGARAALLRWKAGRPGVPGWEFAHVLVGSASTLTIGCALQMPELSAGGTNIPVRGRLPRITDISLIQEGVPAAARTQSRSAAAVELLVPLLSGIFGGAMSMTVPWTGHLVPEAALWGLTSILTALGDNRPLSFMTYAADSCPAPPGLFASFNPRAAKMPLDQVYGPVSIRLATSYADAGRSGLEQILAQHSVLEPADQAGRIARLLELWPGPEPSGSVRQDAAQAASPPGPNPGGHVICPMCLSGLDWSKLPLWRWDAGRGDYVLVEVPTDAPRQLRAHLERGAMVRCPNQYNIMQGEHYLPADYGNYGPPAVIGFIGLTKSGKSHLLSAMLGEIERGGLDDYGIRTRPIDYRMHRKFLDERVYPFIKENKVLPRTDEGIVTFADAFLAASGNAPERPVALFDVAGGELVSVDNTKHFLNVADGLIFVVDPSQLDIHGLGDESFNTVLGALQSAHLLPDKVCAAIVVNKADMIRFEDPIAVWLRSDGRQLDAEEIIRESADVFAYLESRGAEAWTRPYSECAKATLHVASSTGGAGPPEGEGGQYPRGVTPRRVLRPLVALLAMTGVLTGPEAAKVGV